MNDYQLNKLENLINAKIFIFTILMAIENNETDTIKARAKIKEYEKEIEEERENIKRGKEKIDES